MSLIGYMEQGQKSERSITVSGNLTGIASTGDRAVNIGGGGSTSDAVMSWLATGAISPDEARLRLEHEIFGSFGIPGPAIGVAAWGPGGSGTSWARYLCPDCGMEFDGTAPGIARSLGAHRDSGQCEQRRKSSSSPDGSVNGV